MSQSEIADILSSDQLSIDVASGGDRIGKRKLMDATARGGLGWRHAFGDVSPHTALVFAGGSSFGIEGIPIARNAALLEAGVDVELTENATLGIAYQGQIASDAREHGFNAKFGVRF
ncbi:autotransporter outer membrane beta-barrel domain-containing protein [Brucella intermedia]|uniref:autotransporter outer membrane beta-barrel domain-containing protein n=1 Tax=Brucella intermedia TaxID=94625 RepID=UPI002360EA28|nr:autotransporter domain-containing protein [Brucella intermedia]